MRIYKTRVWCHSMGLKAFEGFPGRSDVYLVAKNVPNFARRSADFAVFFSCLKLQNPLCGVSVNLKFGLITCSAVEQVFDEMKRVSFNLKYETYLKNTLI